MMDSAPIDPDEQAEIDKDPNDKKKVFAAKLVSIKKYLGSLNEVQKEHVVGPKYLNLSNDKIIQSISAVFKEHENLNK